MKIEKVEKTNLQFKNRDNYSDNRKDSQRKNKEQFERNFKKYIITEEEKQNCREDDKTIYNKTPQQKYEELLNKYDIELLKEKTVQIKNKDIER